MVLPPHSRCGVRLNCSCISGARGIPFNCVLLTWYGLWSVLCVAILFYIEEGDSTGVSVSGELVEISDAKLERIKANEPDGIVPGRVILDDGREVIGALGDIAVMRGKVTDITSFGGFTLYKASLKQPQSKY